MTNKKEELPRPRVQATMPTQRRKLVICLLVDDAPSAIQVQAAISILVSRAISGDDTEIVADDLVTFIRQGNVQIHDSNIMPIREESTR